MQLVADYRGNIARDKINEKLEEGWNVVAMTSYNYFDDSRVIVVYQADESELEEESEE